ncbi:unnamed protein product [Arctia plantaginis]|uniref:Uncharacterized protein n=1 Tax=Arctia plantaginis TaxID=874455 RepID=A0A8S0Z6F5_ARCPL|nr:unnamed protein product [Arctia plantaginis]
MPQPLPARSSGTSPTAIELRDCEASLRPLPRRSAIRRPGLPHSPPHAALTVTAPWAKCSVEYTAECYFNSDTGSRGGIF